MATETAERKSKKRKRSPATYWAVTLTHFVDDFKPRGKNWSKMRGPFLFRSQERAQEFLQRKLMRWCFQHICDYYPGDEEYEKEYLALVQMPSWINVQSFTRKLANGTYINTRLEWKLEQLQLLDQLELPFVPQTFEDEYDQSDDSDSD